ncbi:MAG: hypothetical protein WBA12_13135, partial [Catalinimonas sp.]
MQETPSPDGEERRKPRRAYDDTSYGRRDGSLPKDAPRKDPPKEPQAEQRPAQPVPERRPAATERPQPPQRHEKSSSSVF